MFFFHKNHKLKKSIYVQNGLLYHGWTNKTDLLWNVTQNHGKTPMLLLLFSTFFNCALKVQLLFHYIRKKLVFYFWNSRYAYQLTWFVCKPCRLKPDKTICRSPRKKCPASTAGAQNKSPLTVLPTKMPISEWIWYRKLRNCANFHITIDNYNLSFCKLGKSLRESWQHWFLPLWAPRIDGLAL